MRAVLLGVVLAGCRFTSTVEGVTDIACASATECPSPLQCQLSVSRCVTTVDEQPPFIVLQEVRVVALAENPLEQPTALGPLASVRISLVVNEPLAADPVVAGWSRETQDRRASCTVSNHQETNWAFTCQVDSSGPDSTLEWRVALIDQRQLVANLTLTAVTSFDVTAPESPVTVDGGVLIRDAPWGDSLVATPWTRLHVVTAASAGSAFIATRRGALQLSQAALRRDAGVLELELPRTEGTQPFEVRGIDEAGNASAWVKVSHGRWVASFNDKVAERTFPNPHRFQTTGALPLGVEGFPVSERGAADGIDRPAGRVAEVEGAGRWLSASLGSFPATTFSAVAFDPLRARVVRFGAARRSDGLPSSQVWEWTGLEWAVQNPLDPEGDGDPSARYAASLVWDPRLRGLVMLGGNATTSLQDAWLWNGKSWRRLADLPRAVQVPTVLYDEGLKALTVSGGLLADASISYDSFQLTSDGWVAIATPPYGVRLGAATCASPLLPTTWVLSGTSDGALYRYQTGGWVRIEPTAEWPAPRVNASCVIDQVSQRLVLFGGQLLGDGGVNQLRSVTELWEFDGQRFRQVHTDGGPQVGVGSPLVYDSARGNALLAAEDDAQRTWAYRSAGGWEVLSAPQRASDFVLTANLAWNSQTGSLEAIAATDEPPFQVEVARVTDLGWRRQAIPPIALIGTSRRVGPDGRWVVGGDRGRPVQILELRGGVQWAALVVDAGFAADSLQAAALGNEGFVLHSTSADGGVLEHQFGLSGEALGHVDRGPVFATSAETKDGGVAVLLSRGLVGGSQLLHSGVATGELSAPFVPFAMVADPARDSLLVPGGFGVSAPTADVWEWSRGAWSRLPIANPDGQPQPQFQRAPVMGYSPLAHGLVVLERTSSFGPGRLWLLQIERDRPMALVRLSTSTLPRGSQLREVIVRGNVGGEGGDGEFPGVLLWPRWPGFWATPSELTQAPTRALAPVTFSYDALNLFVANSTMEALDELTFGLTPRGTNGAGLAKVAVDFIEVELGFEWPP